MQAQGGYSGKDKVMIYFVVNRFQIGKLKEIVREIDKKAYISIYGGCRCFQPKRFAVNKF